jgi:hypothetical protein
MRFLLQPLGKRMQKHFLFFTVPLLPWQHNTSYLFEEENRSTKFHIITKEADTQLPKLPIFYEVYSFITLLFSVLL